MKARNSPSSKKAKPRLGYRIGRSLRSAGGIGRDAVRNPKALPGRAHGIFRRWFRKVWQVRGGGLYAIGYAACFLFFEARTIAGEIADSQGIGAFIGSQVTEFLMRFATDTIVNMVSAFIWPVYVIQLDAVYGGIALGLAFWLFPIYLKKPIEQWLFADDEADDDLRRG